MAQDDKIRTGSGALKKRGPGGKFQPGVSGNPKGRPKTNEEFVDACREGEDLLLRKLMLLGLKGTGNTAVKAIELRLAYGRGRPKVITELTGKDGAPLVNAETAMAALRAAVPLSALPPAPPPKADSEK